MPDRPHARGLVDLDDAEALRLAASMPIARVVWADGSRLFVTPVNFLLQDRDVFVRTAEGTELLEAARRGAEALVEVDDVVDWSRSGWSTVIRGRLSEVRDAAQLQQVLDTGPQPWAGGDRERAVRLQGDEVSGRRIEPGPGGTTVVSG